MTPAMKDGLLAALIVFFHVALMLAAMRVGDLYGGW